MKSAPKTIRSSGSLKRNGAVDELEQKYRNCFKVKPLGDSSSQPVSVFISEITRIYVVQVSG